ncbi:MAG: hypothetical protein GX910_01305 [Clostridiaceae bacterium]|jgi:hypothetical protein|nr:hypothetical protein [Clostridiaceae bacterium]
MEYQRIIRIQDIVYYILAGWREMLACMLVAALLVAGLGALRPEQKPVVQELTAEEKKTIRDTFIAQNGSVKQWQNAINYLSDTNSGLNTRLKNDYYLQIDPENRVNKRFEVTISLLQTDEMTTAEKAQLSRSLSLRYLQQVSSEAFMKSLADYGPIPLNAAYVSALVTSEITAGGSVVIQITGPSEEMIDQLVRNAKDQITKVIHTELDLYQPHDILFTKERVRQTKDDQITRVRDELQGRIDRNNNSIQYYQGLINQAVEEKIAAAEEEKNAANPSPPAKASILKNIILGLLLGFAIGVVLILLRERKTISGQDIDALARQLNLLFIGVLSCHTTYKKGRKQCHGKFDSTICRLFNRYYSEEKATKDVAYVAEVLNGLAVRAKGNQDEPIRVLVPGTADNAPRKAALKAVQDALEKRGTHLLLEAVGDLSSDPDAVGALQGASGLIFFWGFSDSEEKVVREYQLGTSLVPDIWGVLEADAKA